MEYLFIRKEMNDMKDIGKKEKNKEKGHIIFLMEISLLEIGKRVQKKDLDMYILKMGQFFKDVSI
jgi:hypothetical protein